MTGDPYWNNSVLAMHMEGEYFTPDPYFANVVMLLHFNEGNGSTTTVDSSSYNRTISQYVSTVSSTYHKFGVGSMGGTNGYIAALTSADFDFGSGDFTIESWIYPLATGVMSNLIGRRTYPSDFTPFTLRRSASNFLTFTASADGATNFISITGTIAIPSGAWTHIAVSRIGDVFTIFVNGVVDGTQTASGSLVVNNKSITLGSDLGGNDPFNGYFDECRITKGVGRYSIGFTPAIAAFSPNVSTTFIDWKGHTITANGNALINTVQSKFGGTSAYFDGTGDYLTIPNTTDFAFGTGDFTIEAWIYPLSVVGIHCIWASSASNEFSLYTNGSGLECGRYGVYGMAYTGGTGITNNAWQHIAVTRSSGILRLFIGGVAYTPAFDPLNIVNTGLHRIGVDYAGSNGFYGYIDDLRITKGTARYTSTYTPSALAFPNAPAMISGTIKDSTNVLVPRTVRAYRKSDGALSGAVVSHSTTGAFSIPALDASQHFAVTNDCDGDPYWPNVVLASHFNTDSVVDPYLSNVVLGLHIEGANASTTFTDVTGKTVTASGATISTDTSRFGVSSAKFNGSSNYLRIAHTAALNPIANDFTIEAWIYPTAFGTYNIVVSKRITGTSNVGFTIWYNATNVVFEYGTTGTNLITGGILTTTISLNQWQHIAVVKYLGSVTIYKNGVGNTPTPVPSIYASTADLIIGGGDNGTNNYVTGYIDDFRYIVGSSVYTTNFTAPTVPFSSFKDLIGKDLMVNGNVAINTGIKKYGNGSMYFDGTGDYLLVAAHPDFSMGTGDFTVEVFAYALSTGTRRIFSLQGTSSTDATFNALTIRGVGNGDVNAVIAGAGVAQLDLNTSDAPMLLNTWIHIALVRINGLCILFVNGVNKANGLHPSSITFGSIPAYIGTYDPTTEMFIGYLDDLRITKGVARYKSDFTPPEREFTTTMTTGTFNAQVFDNLIPV